MLVRIANRENHDQNWVHTVCLGLFDLQLAFKILEHLPYNAFLPGQVAMHARNSNPRHIQYFYLLDFFPYFIW